MPNISSRGEQTPYSPFRKFMPLADATKAKGIHVYHLNIGQPDIITPPSAMKALHHLDMDIIAYGPGIGNLSYRQALTKYYQQFDMPVDTDDIIITSGASEGVPWVLMTCLEQGDEVIVLEPFYANYTGFAHMSDVHLSPITTHIETGFALPDISAFEKAIGPKTKAIMITNPNNPTGCLYNQEKIEALVALCKTHNLFLIVDEVYREFNFSASPFFSPLSIKGAENHVIILDSISKRFSACGARVGAILCKHPQIKAALTRLANIRLSPPALGQIVAEKMLEEDPSYMRNVFNEYKKRRDVVYASLSQMEGVTAYLPTGAFYCFARIPVKDTDHFCQWLLTDFEYEGATLMLAPGAAFYATPGLGNDEIRIAYVLNEKDLQQAMLILAEALKVYPGRKE